VRTSEWNYSAIWNKEKFRGEYKPQLYDLRKDHDELKSVTEDHPEVLRHLQAKLEEYIASGRDITDGSFSQEG
jgi:hypothetical protein